MQFTLTEAQVKRIYENTRRRISNFIGNKIKVRNNRIV